MIKPAARESVLRILNLSGHLEQPATSGYMVVDTMYGRLDFDSQYGGEGQFATEEEALEFAENEWNPPYYIVKFEATVKVI